MNRIEQQEPPPSRWIIKKEISIADLAAFATSMTFVILAWGTLDKRIALLEEARIEQQKTDLRQDHDAIRLSQEIREQLIRMNDKLDRLTEARSTR